MKEGIRFANSREEFKATYQLRYKIYVESLGRLRDEADHNTKELHDDYDKTARVLITVKDGSLTGTLRLIWGGDAPLAQSKIDAYHLTPFMNQLKENQVCIVERLMVSEKHRGTMTALRMYEEVMNFVLNHQVEVVLLLCEVQDLGLYLKLGFRPYNQTYAPGIGPAIPMALIVGDYEHLKSVCSPFTQLVREDDLSHCSYVKKLQSIVHQESKAYSHSAASNIDSFEHFYNVRYKLYDKMAKASYSRLKLKLSACG